MLIQYVGHNMKEEDLSGRHLTPGSQMMTTLGSVKEKEAKLLVRIHCTVTPEQVAGTNTASKSRCIVGCAQGERVQKLYSGHKWRGST